MLTLGDCSTTPCSNSTSLCCCNRSIAQHSTKCSVFLKSNPHPRIWELWHITVRVTPHTTCFLKNVHWYKICCLRRSLLPPSRHASPVESPPLLPICAPPTRSQQPCRGRERKRTESEEANPEPSLRRLSNLTACLFASTYTRRFTRVISFFCSKGFVLWLSNIFVYTPELRNIWRIHFFLCVLHCIHSFVCWFIEPILFLAFSLRRYLYPFPVRSVFFFMLSVCFLLYLYSEIWGSHDGEAVDCGHMGCGLLL
jgi:hypothetical protein